MAVFSGSYYAPVEYYYGYSYILGWVVTGGALVVGVGTKQLNSENMR